VHPPPLSTGWADLTIMMECTPESGHCHSVCSVVSTIVEALPTVELYENVSIAKVVVARERKVMFHRMEKGKLHILYT